MGEIVVHTQTYGTQYLTQGFQQPSGGCFNDTVPPMAVCSNVTVQLNAAGMGTVTVAMLDGGSTDDCQLTDISVVNPTFECTDLGLNAVMLSVTDIGGNTTTCVANAVVEDNIPPTALCQDATLTLDTSGVASISDVAMIDGGSSDNLSLIHI